MNDRIGAALASSYRRGEHLLPPVVSASAAEVTSGTGLNTTGLAPWYKRLVAEANPFTDENGYIPQGSTVVMTETGPAMRTAGKLQPLSAAQRQRLGRSYSSDLQRAARSLEASI